MSYRKEMQELILEMQNNSRKAKTEETREKWRRRAEVLDFIINHPDEAKSALDA